MDALTQLESRVEQLLARLKTLEAENSRLESELCRARRENHGLVDENHSLRNSLRKCESIRCQVLQRIDLLRRRIRDRGNIG